MNPNSAAERIAAHYPDLAPLSITLLGQGFDSFAFEVNGEFVFRFGKRDDVAEMFAVEAQLLPAIAPRLPLPVPRFLFHADGFVGYRKLAGAPAIRCADVPFDRIAEPLGRFLRALHSFDINTANALGVQPRPLDTYLDEVREEAIEDFHHVRSVAPDAPLDRWLAFLHEAVATDPAVPHVLTHHDIAAEHVLVDGEALTGVIDWSDVAISDRIADLYGVFHWGGESFLQTVMRAYGEALTPRELACVRSLAAYRGVADVKFGLGIGKPEYVQAGIRALSFAAP